MEGENKITIPEAISEKAKTVIMEGVKVEQEAAQLYEVMGTTFNSLGHTKAGQWFKTHAQEERVHSEWVIQFLEDKHVKVEFQEIPKAQKNLSTAKDILAEAYKHEQSVTAFWQKAATECLKVADHDAYAFCLQLLKEQREELSLFGDLINLYNMAPNKSVFDKHLIHP